MKTILQLLLLSLLFLPQAFAQSNSVYGTGAGTGRSFNTHIGYYAGRFSTAGQNTFIGSLSGYSNTTGNKNDFIGNTSGSGNTNGSYNTFLGFGSGQYNTTGNSNTFLGSYSGSSNSSGGYNTFLGDHSGYVNTTGSAIPSCANLVTEAIPVEVTTSFWEAIVVMETLPGALTPS